MNTKKKNRYCVIMCGGIGSRFWPLSRAEMPKQFLDLFGSGRTLLQMTVDRIKPLVDTDKIVLVTNARYETIIRQQLPEISPSNILYEPVRRNTAPCVCWAAHHIAAADPDAVIMTLPSDHLILKEEAFCRALDEAADFTADNDALLTLGIRPNSPHTGYGYIQLGPEVPGTPGIRKVKSFTEKPDLAMAELFLSTGEFFWNAGIFVWTARSILNAFDCHDTDTATIFNADTAAYGTPREKEFIDEIFPNAPSNSIDYAILEKADNVYVKTADIGWSDLGSWKALFETSPRNADGNVTQRAKVLARDCSGSVFASDEGKIIVAVGLKDYIVADRGNALLICPISEEQRIKTITNDVKSRFGNEFV